MKSVTIKAAVVIPLISAILLVSPVLAKDPTAPSPKGADVKNQNLQTRLASKEAALSQRMEGLKERIASKHAELKVRLDQFRDQKKATAAARISENLNKINDKQTEQMLKHLDKMTAILDKLEDRVDRGTPDIKDPAKAKVAIASASAAIASASAAVNAQAEKDYTLTGSSESTIRAEAKAARDRLHADLQAVRRLVIDAKQAVGNAIRIAKSGKSFEKEATSSGQ